jgi:5-carboxymethyl-2-hydroxymuconate isomerase
MMGNIFSCCFLCGARRAEENKVEKMDMEDLEQDPVVHMTFRVATRRSASEKHCRSRSGASVLEETTENHQTRVAAREDVKHLG